MTVSIFSEFGGHGNNPRPPIPHAPATEVDPGVGEAVGLVVGMLVLTGAAVGLAESPAFGVERVYEKAPVVGPEPQPENSRMK